MIWMFTPVSGHGASSGSRVMIVARREWLLVGDRGEDEPLTTGRLLVPLPRSAAVVAWDLHPPELGQQRVVEALADRGITDGQAQMVEGPGGAHSLGVPEHR